MFNVKKVSAVAEIESIYRENSAVLIVHYHGLTVSQIYGLRSALRKDSIGGFKIIKNTLAKIAANNTGYDASVIGMFSGPVAMVYSNDVVSLTKLIAKFVGENDSMKIIGGVLDSTRIDVDTVKKLSTLPSLLELRGQLVGLLQAPATRIVRLINAPAEKVVRVLDAYAKK